jgi:hypothetical protein
MNTVQILIVTDDWESALVNGGFLQWGDQPIPDRFTGPHAREFHLGEFIKVLQETVWMGFSIEITKAHRAKPSGTVTVDQLKQDRGADVVGFRFDRAFQVNEVSRQLSDYDTILFFPIDPDPDESEDELQKEAEAIAQFMENGGGFFATGDHENLGAPICKNIPRVRSMRRWYTEPSPNGEPIAPSGLGADRHDTTRAGIDRIINFEDQSDDVAQEIKPTWYDGGGFSVVGGYPARIFYPHPLLCSPNGVVRYLPDHMHEGWCEVPDNLTDRTFKIGNETLAEYPVYSPTNAPLAPEVVATGEVLGGHPTPAIDPKDHASAPENTIGKTFGVIGAWDGHRVNKGRVVVDSTWHHFFNINLTGDLFLQNYLPNSDQKLFGFYTVDPSSGKRVPNEQYQMIQWYFRNIIYWLIPADRMQFIWWHSLIEFTSRPQLAEELRKFHRSTELTAYTFEHLFYFGQLAEEYLRKARGACAVPDVHIHIFLPRIPPWEWVEEIIDIWKPRVKTNNPNLANLRLAGVLGTSPKPEVVLNMILGSAVLAASQMRVEFRNGIDEKAFNKLMKIWPKILEHGFGQLKTALQSGLEANKLIEETLSLPISEVFSSQSYLKK